MNNEVFRTLDEHLIERIKVATDKINCSKAGKILSVNEDGTATVELFDGTKLNCLLFCFSGAGAFIDFEDYKNSYCLVIFNDDDITRFKTQNDTLKDLDARKHTLNNGVALSGIFPFGKRPQGKKHFVSYEQLEQALTKFYNELKISLTTTAIAGNGSPQASWTNFPSGIDISASNIGGIVHND